MKTLSKLIDDGLPVGALVKDEYGRFYQYISTHEDGDHKVYKLNHNPLKYWIEGADDATFQPTTAHDSNIDPKTLPIAEPFWTGWFMVENRGPMQYDPIHSDNEFSLIFSKEGHCYDVELCQPCLPPL